MDNSANKGYIIKSRVVAVTAVGIAGFINLLILSSRFLNYGLSYSLFFGLIGLLQILWALAFWQRPNTLGYYTGLALSGGLIIFLTFVLAWTPFAEQYNELTSLWSITNNLIELLGFWGLFNLAACSALVSPNPREPTTLLIEAFVVALVVGSIGFGICYMWFR